jgi:hypothetical protein
MIRKICLRWFRIEIDMGKLESTLDELVELLDKLAMAKEQ